MQEQWVPGVTMDSEIDTEGWDVKNTPHVAKNRMDWSGSRRYLNPRSYHQLKLNATKQASFFVFYSFNGNKLHTGKSEIYPLNLTDFVEG